MSRRREDYRGGDAPQPPPKTLLAYPPGIYVGNYRDPKTHEIVQPKVKDK